MNSLKGKIIFSLFLTIVLFSGCKDGLINEPDDKVSLDAALMEIADNDETVASFEPNYNEEDALSFLGKTTTEIFPVRVGQRMRLTGREITRTISGDSAYVQYTKSFSGVMLIAASYDSLNSFDSTNIDTLISKPFSAEVKINMIFERIANTDNERRNWKLAAISLPEGGSINNGTTFTGDIEITSITLTTPSGTIVNITDPLNYFINRQNSRYREMPEFTRNGVIPVTVELNSLYESEDFVTVTHGANKTFKNRIKRRLELVSSTFNGNVYAKVYQGEIRVNALGGLFFGIINAVPHNVIFDDSAPVAINSWGLPYRVQ